MIHLESLQEIIGYEFKKPDHLLVGLTHKSFANETKNGSEHNEKYEFLGDAILDLVTSEFLFKRFSKYSEGELSKYRAALVNENFLAKQARNLEIGPHILLGKGEGKTGGSNKDSILANTLEAIVAALYLDGGVEAARKFIEEKILDLDWDDYTLQDLNLFDPKTRLQELAQNKWKSIPKYRMVKSQGPDHAKTFHVQLSVGDHIIVDAIGRSKKEAEQNAARRVINEQFSPPRNDN